MRLTKKNATKEGTTISMPKAVACYWKLKDLEDIEDELGIDLITLFKIINSGKVYNKKYGYYDCCSVDTHDKTIYFDNRKVVKRKPMDVLKLKDYGKTWALTEEELEK